MVFALCPRIVSSSRIRPLSCTTWSTNCCRSSMLDAFSNRQSYFATLSSDPSNESKSNKVPFYGLPRSETTIKSEGSNFPYSLNERLKLTIQNAIIAFRNPERADAVAAVGELTGQIALEQLLQSMQNNATGRIILQDRPIVSKLTIPYEKLIGDSKDYTFQQVMNEPNLNITFGQAYGAFLSSHEFDPDERDEVKYIENNDLAYIMLRYRQCHDFYHTLTGLPPTVTGELGLKWLELFQTGLPLAALSATFGSLTLSNSEQQVLWNVYLPWAQNLSKKIPFGTLLNVYYEKEWNTPLLDLRHKLQIQPALRV